MPLHPGCCTQRIAAPAKLATATRKKSSIKADVSSFPLRGGSGSVKPWLNYQQDLLGTRDLDIDQRSRHAKCLISKTGVE
jgi:hypothetical protein